MRSLLAPFSCIFKLVYTTITASFGDFIWYNLHARLSIVEYAVV